MSTLDQVKTEGGPALGDVERCPYVDVSCKQMMELASSGTTSGIWLPNYAVEVRLFQQYLSSMFDVKKLMLMVHM